MWKPFLARSLRSVLGGRRRHAVPPDGADRIFSRAYTGREPKVGGGGGGEGRLRSNRHHKQQRPHLYVVLRDWKEKQDVYSFNKLRLDGALEDMNGGGTSEGDGMEKGSAQNLRRLPEPILRIGSRGIGTHARIHALGSNIVVTGNRLTLVYGTDTGELDIVGQDLPDELRWHYDAVAAGGKLHALHAPFYLWEAPKPVESGYDDGFDDEDETEGWTWTWDDCRSPTPMPTSAGASYELAAHAVHPDGRTVFVSFDRLSDARAHHTFSLDTQSGEWTHRGNWRLPFHHQGHYDGDLEAWVGLAALGTGGGSRYYHLSSCDVPDLAGGSKPPPPACRLGREKLTLCKAHLTATAHSPVLVHTGHGRLCIVEAAPLERASADDRSGILRVTMFRPKYAKNGELAIAATPKAARSYLISGATSFEGLAFWM
uniref:Uncharacterized protein n=1 Tax=Avena sativa TaxID=4498 RepID=A0ACD5TCM8_AVESA